MLPTAGAKLAPSPGLRASKQAVGTPRRSNSSSTLHLDPGEEYVLSQTSLKYVFGLVLLVLLYLAVRVMLAQPTDAGLVQFKFETCINVMGFKQDRNGFARSKCWADMTYKQGVEKHQLNFKFFGPISHQQFLQDLKRYKEYFPEAAGHVHSPLVYEGCDVETAVYVGGVEQLVSLLQQRYLIENTGDCW